MKLRLLLTALLTLTYVIGYCDVNTLETAPQKNMQIQKMLQETDLAEEWFAIEAQSICRLVENLQELVDTLQDIPLTSIGSVDTPQARGEFFKDHIEADIALSKKYKLVLEKLRSFDPNSLTA